ncbi:MAG: hypothetical protein ACK45U_05575 [bacterium]|jgi:hypothetical protein
MSDTSQDSLVIAIKSHFGEQSLPALQYNIDYEDLRSALAAYIKSLMNENKAYLYASLYRIDVSEKDVRLALSQNIPEFLLAEMILKKLKEKLYWRNKYKTNDKID